MKKIENQYCLASHFEAFTVNGSLFGGTPIDPNYMHQTVSCFTPILTLSGHFMVFSSVLIYLLMAF